MAGIETDEERGTNYQRWLADRIAIQYLHTETINPSLSLEFAQRYGVEAEKALITRITSLGAN